MRIAICDDEKPQRLLLKKYLENWALQNKVILETQQFVTGENFLFAWEDDRDYDLLVFDIEMGRLSGIELAAAIREKDDEIPILFVTGYDKYMLQGFEVAALHYLLKPVNPEKLFEVLDRLKMRRKQEGKLIFQTEKGPVSLPASRIWYIEARAHQCVLYTEDEEYTLRASISEMAGQLGGRREFVRCHRSYIVNLHHVSAIVKPGLFLDDRRRLPVSRSAEKEVNRLFIELFRG